MNLGLSSAPKAQVVYSPLWCGASGPTNKGASFVEIYQNCIVYNDDVFAPFTEKKAAPANQIWLENGKPMLFAGSLKGLTLDRQALKLEVVDIIDGDWEKSGVIVHDETNKGIAQMLIDMPSRSKERRVGKQGVRTY